MADENLITIGKVVKRLSRKYPHLSVSKIRFLESEGLLNPARTPAGYRLYSTQDITRLETILYLQNTKFLPLDIIKQRLEASDSRAALDTIETRSAVDGEEVLSNVHPIDKASEYLNVTPIFLHELAKANVITFQVSKSAHEYIDGRDFPLIRCADVLSRLGMEPRNLRQFVNSANREAGIFEQILAPIRSRLTVQAVFDEASGRGTERAAEGTVESSSEGTPRKNAQKEYEARLDALIKLTQTLHEQLLRRIFEKQ